MEGLEVLVMAPLVSSGNHDDRMIVGYLLV